METKTKTIKEGDTVRVWIENRETYTNDLYKALQGESGIVEKININSYETKYLVIFPPMVSFKYACTHNGKWSNTSAIEPMAWWINDFDLLNN